MKYHSRNTRGTAIKTGPATKSRILPGVLSLLAGIAPVALSTTGNAGQVIIDASQAALRPVRVSWRVKLGPPDIGTLQSGRQSRLDPRLAGEWYWEADSVYVPGADILIKATSILTIHRDGGLMLQEEGSELGGVNYQGQLEQQGDTLTGYCDNGQTFTTKFALDGSNGLWVAGRLYGRQ